MLQGVDFCEALGTGVATTLVEGSPRVVTAVHLWGDHLAAGAGSLIAAVGATEEQMQHQVVGLAASVEDAVVAFCRNQSQLLSAPAAASGASRWRR